MAMQKISLDEKETPQPGTTMKVSKKKLPLTAIFVAVAVILGSTTGVLLAKNKIASKGDTGVDASLKSAPSSKSDIKVGDTFGSADESTFSDEAEGVLVVGGIEGEGSHHLVRPGGEMQNVYLTSSVVDLDLFVGHKIKVWGETVGAKHAGWLMDAGRVKVVELNAELPE